MSVECPCGGYVFTCDRAELDECECGCLFRRDGRRYCGACRYPEVRRALRELRERES